MQPLNNKGAGQPQHQRAGRTLYSGFKLCLITCPHKPLGKNSSSSSNFHCQVVPPEAQVRMQHDQTWSYLVRNDRSNKLGTRDVQLCFWFCNCVSLPSVVLLSYSLIKGFSGLPVTRSQTSSQPLNNSGCFHHPSLGWIPSSCGASVAKSSRARGRSCMGHCSRTSTTGLVAECLGEASFGEPWNLNTQTSKRDELAIISHIKIQNDLQSLGFLFLCELPKGWAPAIQTPLSLSLFFCCP